MIGLGAPSAKFPACLARLVVAISLALGPCVLLGGPALGDTGAGPPPAGKKAQVEPEGLGNPLARVRLDDLKETRERP
ncbi:MAG: hypothetical protein JOY94_19920, partial [Methylobacteriaceae bacterium]|nr:hypothetical protein [Methylobacteriaceae bacterium]